MSSEVKFLTIEQVAEMLQVTKMTIYNLQKKGLPFIKLGKNVRFDKEDVIEWVNSNKKTDVQDK
jgi:excisionase family DNA binding protein